MEKNMFLITVFMKEMCSSLWLLKSTQVLFIHYYSLLFIYVSIMYLFVFVLSFKKTRNCLVNH